MPKAINTEITVELLQDSSLARCAAVLHQHNDLVADHG